MKTKLTPEDKDKAWKSLDIWICVVWIEDGWYVYSCDPRTNTMLTNYRKAAAQKDGELRRSTGFIEVP